MVAPPPVECCLWTSTIPIDPEDVNNNIKQDVFDAAFNSVDGKNMVVYNQNGATRPMKRTKVNKFDKLFLFNAQATSY